MADRPIEITTRNLIDIERYTNDIRTQLLAELRDHWKQDGVSEESTDVAVAVVAGHFDRANVKALFAHLSAAPQRPDNVQQLPATATKKPGPRPGSKAAGDRARKAAETRRKNAEKRGTVDSLPSGNAAIGIPGTSSAQFGTSAKDGE